ncbi:hypothetical protein VTN96DRAFT_9968 [Rasamsonia emersonii]
MLTSVAQSQEIFSLKTRLDKFKDQLQSSAPSSCQQVVVCPSPEDSSGHPTAVSLKHGSRKKQTRKVRLKLPPFLGGKVWEVYSDRVLTEWTFRLRSYNVIPELSLIFIYAWNGDLAGIKRLLQERRASVFDCAPNGWTAFHVSKMASSRGVEEEITSLLT